MVKLSADQAHQCAALLRSLFGMICITKIWLAIEPLNMRAEPDNALSSFLIQAGL